MTDRLSLYNGALRLLRDRKLASLTENREPRRLLDDAWNEGAVDFCLQAGQWKFAKRSGQIDYSPSVEPGFPGMQYAFDLPEDFVRTIGMWSDEAMQNPYREYRQEAGFWWGNLETMYVSYVSNDAAYGGDMSMWPMSFVKFVEAHLAVEIAGPLTEKGMESVKARDYYLREALSKDAMEDPSRRIPDGSWVRSRGGFGRSRRNGQP